MQILSTCYSKVEKLRTCHHHPRPSGTSMLDERQVFLEGYHSSQMISPGPGKGHDHRKAEKEFGDVMARTDMN